MGSRVARRALRIALGALWLASRATAQDAACREDLALLRLPDGRQAQFTVEIADDADERAQGLMHRRHMATGAGMLFVYEDEHPVAFWMKNTLIPLDMLFIDATGRVISVHGQARPEDETPIPSEGPVRFVLEINGGLARRIGIAPGATLAHPAIDPDSASWRCE